MDKINDAIAKHRGLIYTQLKRFKLNTDQDAESAAYEALYKAVLTYDVSSGNKFSTYATCVIANALRMHLRNTNKKRQLTVISYYEPASNIDSDERFMLDTITGQASAEEMFLNAQLATSVDVILEKIYSEMTIELHRRILRLWKDSGFTKKQTEIANELKVSQPTVSKVLNIIRYKLKKELEDYV